MLILVLAANTSFADFPRLASFQAGDNFMPRQLTKRGHRLVFSNGIIALAVAAGVLVVITGAKVTRLIPLYAIGVFTVVHALAGRHGQAPPHAQGAGLAHGPGHQRRRRRSSPASSTIVIAVTKFTDGAWVIIVLVPILVCGRSCG